MEPRDPAFSSTADDRMIQKNTAMQRNRYQNEWRLPFLYSERLQFARGHSTFRKTRNDGNQVVGNQVRS